MRFGGHETFHIRDGWLHKGVELLYADAAAFNTAEAADLLGVGANMAKSIKHWLKATGLSDNSTNQGRPKLSNLGKLVRKHDPYFLSDGTWWILHVNLATNPQQAASWEWFYSSFYRPRFDRGTIIASLERFLKHRGRKVNIRTLERDIAVFLSTYSESLPAQHADPEDSKDCPFRRLGLMQFFADSGSYVTNTGQKEIPSTILGYSIARWLRLADEETDQAGLQAAATAALSPGRVFQLDGENLVRLLQRAEQELPKGWLTFANLAGNQTISIAQADELEWAKEFYMSHQNLDS